MPWRRLSERTEIVHIVVTGYQKKKYPRKYYVFVIDITWNNSDRFEIYRRYSDFFSFQTNLKAMFPGAAGRRHEERIIPQLPKRIFVGRSHVARVAEARVEQINRYCQTLISLDPKISESAHVIGFFSPRIGDKALPKLHLHRPASLHPQKIPAGSLFEEHCALAEYEAEDESQVSFKSGDKVLVLDKDTSGWWMCQVNDKVGWGPPSYLKRCEAGETEESDSDDEFLGLPSSYADTDKDSGVSSSPSSRNATPNRASKLFVPEIEIQEYKALDSYEAQGDGQVSFEEGDVIQVIDKIEDGWWFVAKGQEEGWVPCSYLEPLKPGQEEDNTISSLDVEKYITAEKYSAEEEDELSFPQGVMVDVLQKSLDGWWLIKRDGKTGLAPATFLKKKRPGNGVPPTVRQGSLPIISIEEAEQDIQLTRNYRQPPRQQSVRKMRLSKKKNKPSTIFFGLAAGTAKLATGSISPIKEDTSQRRILINTLNPSIAGDSDTEDHEYLNIDPQQLRKEKAAQEKKPPSSPTTSDSDVDVQSQKPVNQIRKGIESRIKRFEPRLSSDSEDSSPSPGRRPVALPRNNKPELKPRPKVGLKPKSHSVDNMFPNTAKIPKGDGGRKAGSPQIPERPRMSQISRARSKTSNPDNPLLEPLLAFLPRPRDSEIRRAREGKTTPSPTASPASSPRSPQKLMPQISATVDPGSKNILLSERSAFKPIPMPGNLSNVTGEKGAEFIPASSAPPPKSPLGVRKQQKPLTSGAFAPSFLPPPKPARKRSHSDQPSHPSPPPPTDSSPSPSSSVPETGSSGENPLNQQMAETLIKYILASQDGGLKSALRECVLSDPEALKALKE